MQGDDSPAPIIEKYMREKITDHSPRFLDDPQPSVTQSRIERIVKSFPPSIDDLLARCRTEFHKLRNCNLSRKDMVLFLDIKR